MARTTILVSGNSPAALATNLNTQLALLTTSYIKGVEFTVNQALRQIGSEYGVLLTLDSGSPAITAFEASLFVGQTNASALAQVSAAYLANPGYFYAPPKQCYFPDPRGTKHVGMLLISNSVLADGNSNYLALA